MGRGSKGAAMSRDANGFAGARVTARASRPGRRPVSGGVLTLVAGLVSLGLAGAAAARHESPCAGNLARVGDLGIASIDCDCTLDYRVRSTDGKTLRRARWIFRSEPRVEEVRSDGPAAGKLREGDLITAIDGTDVDLPSLIDRSRRNGMRIIGPGSMGVFTTAEEAPLLAHLAPGTLRAGPVGVSMQSSITDSRARTGTAITPSETSAGIDRTDGHDRWSPMLEWFGLTA